VHNFLRERFNVNLKIWHSIMMDPQDVSVNNAKKVFDKLDPIPLNSIYQIA